MTGSPSPGWGGRAARASTALRGWETLCLQQRNTGYGIDGSYADYVVAEAAFVGLVPWPHPLIRSTPPRRPAPGSPRTRPSRLQEPGRPTSWLSSGIGGLGHLAPQYARIAGATVVAVDVEVEGKLAGRRRSSAPCRRRTLARRTRRRSSRRLGGADAAVRPRGHTRPCSSRPSGACACGTGGSSASAYRPRTR